MSVAMQAFIESEGHLVEVLEFLNTLKTSDLCLQCRTSSTMQPHSRNCKELLRLKVKHRMATVNEVQLADALRIGEPE